MRLEKNGQPYELSEQERKELKAAFPTFPITISYSSRYKKPQKSAGGKQFAARGTPIPLLNQVVHNGKYSGVWNCFNVKSNMGKDLIKYDRQTIHTFKGHMNLGHDEVSTDWNLIFFLYYISPLCENGAFQQNHVESIFQFDRPDEKALVWVMNRKEKRDMEDKIFALEGDALRSVAIAMGKGDAKNESISEEQLQQFLCDVLVDNPSTDAIDRFYKITRSEFWQDLLETVQRGIDLHILKYSQSARNWFLDKGGAMEKLTYVSEPIKRNQTLNVYLSNNAELVERIKDLIKAKQDDIEMEHRISVQQQEEKEEINHTRNGRGRPPRQTN